MKPLVAVDRFMYRRPVRGITLDFYRDLIGKFQSAVISISFFMIWVI